MFITSKWKQDNKRPICFIKGPKGQRGGIDLTLYKVAIIDVAPSIGSNGERIKIIKDILATDSVYHLKDEYFKAILTINTTVPSDSTFRNIYIIPPNIGIMVQLMGANYHSNYSEGKFSELQYDHKPNVCFWDLEVEIPDSGTFPNSNENPITMVSFASNTTANVELYTTLPEKYTASVPCLVFDDEKSMLEHTYHNLKKNDVDVTYWGTGFDWPYLINRLRVLNSTVIEECKDEVVSVEHSTNYSRNWYDTVDSISLDHFDLMLYFRTAYPHFKNHKLNTVAKHLVGSSKIDVDIQELKKLKNLPEEPTQELYDLATNFLAYSIQDTRLLMQLWDKIYPNIARAVKNSCISYSMVGTHDESIAFMYKFKPQMLIYDKNKVTGRIPGTFMNTGVHHNVLQYTYTESMIHCLKSSDDEDTKEMGNLLLKYPHPWVVKDVFLNPLMRPTELAPYENIIGASQNGFFINTPVILDGVRTEHVASYKKIIVVASASWIAVDGDVFEYNGVHSACKHANGIVKMMVETFIRRGRHMSPADIKTIIPNFGGIDVGEFVMTAKVTFFNLNKYNTVLTEEQITKIQNDATSWLIVKYIKCSDKSIKTFDHVKELMADHSLTDILDTEFYVTQIVNVLKRLSTAYH